MKFCRLISFCLISFFVVGCSKKPARVLPNSEERSFAKNKNCVTQAQQCELAVPVGYKLKEYSDAQNMGRESQLFVYEGNLAVIRVANFYKKELELCGWIYSDLSTKKEGVLIANKSLKKCVVSVRPIKENSSSVHIFIQNKQADQQNFVDLNKINGVN